MLELARRDENARRCHKTGGNGMQRKIRDEPVAEKTQIKQDNTRKPCKRQGRDCAISVIVTMSAAMRLRDRMERL
jgi:hypothetical protein